jgi:hypothetical protein
MRTLEEIEHRAVLVLLQPPGDVNGVVRRDPDQVLVVRAVVNGAEAKPVRDLGGTHRVDVRRNMSGIEELDLP